MPRDEAANSAGIPVQFDHSKARPPTDDPRPIVANAPLVGFMKKAGKAGLFPASPDLRIPIIVTSPQPNRRTAWTRSNAS